MVGRHRKALAARVAAAVAACAIAACAQGATLWQAGAFLPSWVSWSSSQVSADLDGDGALEEVAVAAGRLSVTGADGARCQAPSDWLVSDAFVGDVTHDGTPELVAIAWKRGSFGTSKPFWIERDSSAFSQHVFIFDYASGNLEQRWTSSALGFEVHAASLDDAARLHLVDGQGGQTLWEWQSWGLALVDGSAAPDAQAREAGGDAADLTILAVGDVIAHESLYEGAWSDEGRRFDFEPVFSRVSDEVRAYDLAVVNQETPFIGDPSLYGGYPSFGTPTALGDALADAGFDVVTAATNHAYDRGDQGLADTIDFWRDEHPEVALLGIHDSPGEACRCRFVERKGVRLALFNATYGMNGNEPPAGGQFAVDVIGDGERLVAAVSQAEAQSDVTICFLHVGDEYAAEPSAEQRALCERLVDAGADAVICSHPHVLQPVEKVRTKAGSEGVVFWSLGNFASNQLEPETVLGGAATLGIVKAGSSTSISSYGLIGSVCHFEPGVTQVVWLDDYTEDLARRHYVNGFGDSDAITLAKLETQFDEVY